MTTPEVRFFAVISGRWRFLISLRSKLSLDAKKTEFLLYPAFRDQDPVSRTDYPELFNFQKIAIIFKILAHEES